MLEKKQGCTEHTQQITAVDLPLCCPREGEGVWNAHPRVYLPIEATGEVTCSYCGTHYILDRPIP